MPVSQMKVVLAYDGSAGAQAAAADLPRAGLPPDAEVIVLSVAQVWPRLPADLWAADAAERLPDSPSLRRCRELVAQASAEAQQAAREGADRVRSSLPRANVRADTSGGSPQEAVVARAEESAADLVVVGSSGRSAAGRMLLGSVSQNVLSYAPCSVRVGRRPEDAGRLADGPPRLIVGVDGSPDSAAAVSAVADRAWPPGTKAQVLTAFDLMIFTALASAGTGAGAVGTLGDLPDERAWAREAVEAAAEDLRSAGLDATPLVLRGDPKRVLLDAAKEFSADCIFLGAKGHSRMQRLLLGSVSSAVAARAGCSVEVVRQG